MLRILFRQEMEAAGDPVPIIKALEILENKKAGKEARK